MRSKSAAAAAACGLLALLCCLSAGPQGAAAHGSLVTPRARNWQVQLTGGPGWWSTNDAARVNGAENFGNGHGAAVVKPAAGPGVCGDPWQHWNSNYAAITSLPIQATYRAGQDIDVRWLISANHGGRIGFMLCPMGRSGLTQACFDRYPLERSDGLGRHYYIMDGTVNGNMATWYGYMNGRYRLPAGVSCANGCVLQWEYLTMNSCYPSDIGSCNSAACGVYKNRQNPVTRAGNMGNCCLGAGCSASVVPEVFLNCADIVITGGSGPTPPGPTPPGPTPPGPTPPGPAPPGPTPPPPTCNDNRADCTAWGPGLCSTPGVAATCPCMCRSGPTPPGPTPPAPTPPPPTCNDNRADCTAWGPGLCSTPGVATTCPCMCRMRTARAARRANRRFGGQAAAAAAADPATAPAATSVAPAAAAAAVDPAAAAAASSTDVPPLSVVHLSPATEPAAAEGAAGAAP